jgi:hypothetical protein
MMKFVEIYKNLRLHFNIMGGSPKNSHHYFGPCQTFGIQPSEQCIPFEAFYYSLQVDFGPLFFYKKKLL